MLSFEMIFWILRKLEFNRQILVKIRKIKTYENQSSQSQFVPREETEGQADGCV